MIIAVHNLVAPHFIRNELIETVQLAERIGPVHIFSVERYPITLGDEVIELTAHFEPDRKTVSLALVKERDTLFHLMFCAPIPCEFNLTLPSLKKIRLFLDPTKEGRKYRNEK